MNSILKKDSEIPIQDSTEFEAMYEKSEEIYNEEYSKGEYCHEQSFKWGFQEGFDYAMNLKNKV